MRFRENADVVSADGEKVGEIERVVLDPKDDEVTHIVIRQGILFTTDKILPANLVQTATEEQVVLRLDADDLEPLPDFKEMHFVPLQQEEGYVRPVYWYPPAGAYTWGVTAGATLGVGAPTIPPFVVEEQEHVPDDTVPLRQGATVVSGDGKEVGGVESVLTDPEEHRVTHLVIARGLLFQEEKLVPTSWIDTVTEGEVHLTVGSETLRDLPEYETEC